MQLEHSFTIPTDVSTAWSTLLDLERIAPCLPGARIESVAGDEYMGAVDIKVGPIALTYRGTAEFKEADASAHRAVLVARTREARGSGQANATITATLVAQSEEVTRVDVLTDLDITGRPAQFGTGVIGEVGARLLNQFAARLADELGRDDNDTRTTSPASSAGSEKTDLLRLAAGPILRRAAIPVAALVGIVATIVVLRSVRRQR